MIGLSVLSLAVAVMYGCSRSAPSAPAPDDAVAVKMYRSNQSGSSGAETPGTTVVTGTGFGTLKGKFVFGGTAPSRELVSTGGKDAVACEAKGHPVLSYDLIVDSATKGIRNVVLFAQKIKSKRVSESMAKVAETPVEFDQKWCEFTSHILPIQVKQPLVIKNSDPVAHNTNLQPTGDASANPLLSQGQTYDHVFKREQREPIVVTCNVHPWMKAYIFPRANPYVAVTNEKGEFTLPEVPAGEDIEFMIWHETVGFVPLDGWPGGRKTIRVAAEEGGQAQAANDLGTITVPAAALGR